MRLVLVAACVLAASGFVAAPSAGAGVACARIAFTPFGTTRQLAYSVRIVAGRVSCATARRVMLRFMTKDTYPRGWFCARGHTSQNQKWAAACGTAAGADVKVYGPVRR